jgi:hypothetical protein
MPGPAFSLGHGDGTALWRPRPISPCASRGPAVKLPHPPHLGGLRKKGGCSSAGSLLLLGLDAANPPETSSREEATEPMPIDDIGATGGPSGARASPATWSRHLLGFEVRQSGPMLGLDAWVSLP